MANPKGIVAMLSTFGKNCISSANHHFKHFDTIMKDGRKFHVSIMNTCLINEEQR